MSAPVSVSSSGVRDVGLPRIVHVTPSLKVGGLEKTLVRVVTHLSRSAWQAVVTLAPTGPIRDLMPDETVVVSMGDSHRPGRWNAVRMARVFRTLRPDVVHTRNWSCIDAVIAARLANVPIVIQGEHGRDAADPSGQNWRRQRIRRLLSPLITEFVAVSGDLARWLVDEVRIPARKVRTIKNGVDTTLFSPRGRDDARRALGLPDGAIAIGTVGRLDPVKDHRGLLRAFAQLAPDPRLHLLIAGGGPCEAELTEEAQSLGLAGRVRFLGERADVPAILPGFDVFVLPSLGEGMSNTILEAMATGLPVVATKVGGNPELVRHEATGLLIEPRSTASLTAALSRYIEDAGLRTAHGTSARLRAESEFGLGRMLSAYDDLYAGHLAGRSAR